MSNQIYEMIIYKIESENRHVSNEVKSILDKLKKKPENLEELHELRIFCNEKLPNDIQDIRAYITSIMKKMSLLEEMKHKISYEDFKKSWESFGLPLKVQKKKDKCLRNLSNSEKKFSENLMLQQSELAIDVQNIVMELEIFMKISDLDDFKEVSDKFSDLEIKIDKSIKEGYFIKKYINLK